MPPKVTKQTTLDGSDLLNPRLGELIDAVKMYKPETIGKGRAQNALLKNLRDCTGKGKFDPEKLVSEFLGKENIPPVFALDEPATSNVVDDDFDMFPPGWEDLPSLPVSPVKLCQLKLNGSFLAPKLL